MTSGDANADALNQPPPLQDYNLYASDRVLREAVAREGAAWAETALGKFGASLGQADTLKQGDLANRHPPELHAFDRFGQRRDEVEFHPAWHTMLRIGMAHGLHSGPWAEPKPGAHAARAAKVILMVQAESGVQCPLTMTYGSAPVLARHPEIAAQWLPKIYSRDYDERFAPVAEKSAALIGMGMTERQGGSDVRSNTTQARPAGRAGEYRINGHKWFLSAPMCDAFLVLAQAPGGLSCFFMPRFTPDGRRNGIQLQRLKDKLGNRSNASAEVIFEDAHAWLIDQEGRGIATILEMGVYTRLDCVLGSAGLMRQAVAQALHHSFHRTAFQKRLIDQPMMRNVLADLALESEAATVLALRLARAFDDALDPANADAIALRRILTPVAKFWICKRGPILAAEALEVLGGNGFVEDSPMPRLYRELPLNSIWEGSGNVICLDVLRAIARHPESLDALFAEIRPAAAANALLAKAFASLKDDLKNAATGEVNARRLVERLALSLQAALLVRFSDPAVADAFCQSRLGPESGRIFGALRPDADLRTIIDRAMPA
jgi:putative acyl-CoA dehydrogenase